MAVTPLVESLLGGVDPDLKKVLIRTFEYVLKNLRLGRIDHQAPSENFAASFVEATTHAVANTEFSVLHGRETAPYLAVPVLDLQAVGSKIVPLEVSRAADVARIYLKSSEASKPFRLLVEGP